MSKKQKTTEKKLNQPNYYLDHLFILRKGTSAEWQKFFTLYYLMFTKIPCDVGFPFILDSSRVRLFKQFESVVILQNIQTCTNIQNNYNYNYRNLLFSKIKIEDSQND